MSQPADKHEASHVSIGDVDVSYRRKGDGPPAIYFHGMGLTGRWLPLHERLAAELDLTVPDHPGFGDTARPRWFRTLDDIAIHYADFLDSLHLPRVHVVGHSLGGLIAGSFAALYPERVQTLTLIAPAPLPIVGPMPQDPGADADIDDLLFSGNKHSYPEYLDAGDEGGVVASDDGSDVYADPGAWDPSGSPSLYRRLARVRSPRQILVPDDDQLFGRPIFDAWATALHDAPLVAIPGHIHPTAHLLVVQEPEQIADAVARLAQEI